MRYENPLYMAEDAGAADLIAGGRMQLGISRGSPEQVIDGWRHFGYVPPEGQTDADMARRHAEIFLDILRGEGFAKPNPRPMFPNPPGLLRLEPHSGGLRDRIWWGPPPTLPPNGRPSSANLQSSTLKFDERQALHVQQAEQIRPTVRPGPQPATRERRASRSAAASSPSSTTATAPTSAAARTRIISATLSPRSARSSAVATLTSPTRSSNNWPRTRLRRASRCC